MQKINQEKKPYFSLKSFIFYLFLIFSYPNHLAIAGLLDDNEARQAILDLRQKIEQKTEKTQIDIQQLFNNQKQLLAEQLLAHQNEKAIENKITNQITNQTGLIQNLAQQQQLTQQQQQQLLLKVEELAQQQKVYQQSLEQTKELVNQLNRLSPLIPLLPELLKIAGINQIQQQLDLQQQDLFNLKNLMQKIEQILTPPTVQTEPIKNQIEIILDGMNKTLNQANELFSKGKFKESQLLLESLKKSTSSTNSTNSNDSNVLVTENMDLKKRLNNTLIEIFTLQATNEYALNKPKESLSQLQQAQKIIESELSDDSKNHIKLPEILWLKYTLLSEKTLLHSTEKNKILQKLSDLNDIDFYKNNEWVVRGSKELKIKNNEKSNKK